MVKVFGRLHFTQIELHFLMGRLPGWIAIVAKEVARYVLDIPWRLKGSQTRRLTMGAAGVARLRLSMIRREIPLRLNTRLVELVYEDGRVVGAKVESDGKSQFIRVTGGVVLAAGGFRA